MAGTGNTDDNGASVELEAEWADEELGRFVRLKHWTVKEAKYLLNGLDPWAERDLLPGDDPYVHLPYGRDPEQQDSDPELRKHNIEADLELTERFIAAAGIAEPRTRREFLTLAAENGHPVPWLEFARSRPKLRRFLPEGEEDQAKTIEEQRDTIVRLTAENERLRRENEALQPLSGKFRTSVFKLIGGMAKAFYGLNLRKPQTESFRDLLHDLARVGAALSENTVRKLLKEAADHLERPENIGQ